MAHTDILLDDNNDLLIENGDFVVGESAGQEAKLLLLYSPGTLRSDPMVGVGFQSYQNAATSPSVLKTLDRIIQEQFEMDQKTIDSIEYVSDDTNQLVDVNIDFEQTDNQ